MSDNRILDDNGLVTWPPADEAAFKLACEQLRVDPNFDTGRMGTFAALARLQERVLALERRLAAYEAKYGPRRHGAED